MNESREPQPARDYGALITDLSRPEAYSWQPDSVEFIETHISWVFLAGDRVVKLKRPVDLGFVDHTSMAARHRSCLDEVRLNRRLTDGVYLGVVPIVHRSGRHQIGDLLEPDTSTTASSGAAVEWGTLMRRLPAQRMLDRLIQAGDAPLGLAERLANRLIPFHHAAASCGSAEDAAAISAMITAVVTENLDQLQPFAGDPLGPSQFNLVVAAMRPFVAEHGGLLQARASDGWIREGHGDLRAEHICLEGERVQIFDCVEFSREIRCADVASDLAFLLMDLARLGHDAAGEQIVARYRADGFDLPDALLRFYRVHRALVRAKVACMERAGSSDDVAKRYAAEAATYLDHASAQALRLRPALLAMTGLSGTGKSTVATAIARALDIRIILSDVVRKELAGQAGPAPANWGQGLYTADWTAQTYERLGELARDTLAAGKPVLLDATFLDAAERERAATIATAAGVPFLLIETTCDPATALHRIRARAERGGSSSDATEVIYKRQRQALLETPVAIPPGTILATIDTSAAGAAALDPLFATLETSGLAGSALQYGGAPGGNAP